MSPSGTCVAYCGKIDSKKTYIQKVQEGANERFVGYIEASDGTTNIYRNNIATKELWHTFDSLYEILHKIDLK
jgi:hypothetical protein